jgi:hypothetical protein
MMQLRISNVEGFGGAALLGNLPDIFRPADVNKHRGTGHANFRLDG